MSLSRIVLDDRFIRPRYNGHCFADHGLAHGGLIPDEVEIPLLLFYSLSFVRTRLQIF